MPYVSVIVPAYNAESTLHQTIHDILHQSFKDFELILVDDGSTDGTAELCDQFANENPSVRVIHQNNRGVSAARNTGTRSPQLPMPTVCNPNAVSFSETGTSASRSVRYAAR